MAGDQKQAAKMSEGRCHLLLLPLNPCKPTQRGSCRPRECLQVAPELGQEKPSHLVQVQVQHFQSQRRKSRRHYSLQCRQLRYGRMPSPTRALLLNRRLPYRRRPLVRAACKVTVKSAALFPRWFTMVRRKPPQRVMTAWHQARSAVPHLQEV